MRNVFISYSSLDEEEAIQIRQALEANDIPCWMAPRNIPLGSTYTSAIPKGIKECPVFIVIMTRNTQTSYWVPREIEQAINHHKLIIPLFLDHVRYNDEFSFLIHREHRCYALNQAPLPEELFSQIREYVASK